MRRGLCSCYWASLRTVRPYFFAYRGSNAITAVFSGHYHELIVRASNQLSEVSQQSRKSATTVLWEWAELLIADTMKGRDWKKGML